jgi:MFS family permease
MIRIEESNVRWLILFLCCWISFGNYYAFDNPSSLNRQLMEWLGSDFPTWQYQLNAMYSIYSVPNIILPLFVGGLLDKYGTHTLLFILAMLVTIGHAFFCFGVQFKSFHSILFGRFIFGLGGESLTVAQSRLVTDWFRGRELALAIGLTLSVARFGTVFNNILSPGFAVAFGISGATWIGFISCIWSLVCTCLTISLDKLYSQSGAAVQHHGTSFLSHCAIF